MVFDTAPAASQPVHIRLKKTQKSWHMTCFNPYQQTVDINHCLAIVNDFNDKEKEL